MESFFPITILLVISLLLSGSIYAITNILGPQNPLSSKLSPYECGVKPEGNARTPYKSRFYLIAVMFLLLDVEAAFFFPWALIYRDSLKSGGGLLIAMLAYLFFLVLGLAYIFRKNSLELN